MKAAGIDIGSNNVRMIAGYVEDGRILEVLADESGITRLGAGIAQTGELSAESIDKTLALLEKFALILKKLEISHIKAAATSAVREATNSAGFIAKVRAMGIPLETISGEEEARYTAMGALSGMENARGDYLIYDIGGGSTELSLVKEGEVTAVVTVPVGVVKLYDLFGGKNTVTAETLAECTRYTAEQFKGALQPLPESDFALFDPPSRGGLGLEGWIALGTAGSVTTAAAMDMKLEIYDPVKVSAHILTTERIQALLEQTAALSAADRLALPGLQKGREDLVIGGFIIMNAILKGFGFNKSAVSDHGLREGLLIAASIS
jgi:exopolyphosphatase/guanosine-5'-triphosphate,3'-diphosphate pyrophosphatase